MAETTLQRYQREYRKTVEGKTVRKVVKALNASDNPSHHVTGVWDGEQFETAHTPDEVLDLLANLDEGRIVTGEVTIDPDAGFFRSPITAEGWVFIVNGNEWDVIGDYTVNIEDALKPVNDWIEAHW